MATLSPIWKQATSIVVDSAAGCWVTGHDGRRYLDFTAGIGVTSTGHCHPRVVAAARAQVGAVIHAQTSTVLHRPLLELTDKLGAVLPNGLDSVFYANSGAEAVEAAVRLAKMATGRTDIVVFHGGFHGRTAAAAALTTSGTRFRAGFPPLMSGVHPTPFPDAYRYGWDVDTAVDFALRELDHVLTTIACPREIAAMIIEPVLGEGGCVPTPPRFLAGLRERADRHGILLIVDEVQTGVGRTGKFWGHQHSTVTPDILVLAKGIASGFPLSAIAAPTELMSKAWPGSQGGTYGGNAVAAAAAVATLDVVHDEDLVENARVRGAQLRTGLDALAGEFGEIGDVRGLGLMQGIAMVTADDDPDPEAATAVRRAALDQDLLLLTCGGYGNIVRTIPALVVSADEIDRGLERLATTLTVVFR